MKASSTAIQATRASPAPKTMSAPYRMPRPAATEATVIGTATIASSAGDDCCGDADDLAACRVHKVSLFRSFHPS